MGCFFVFRLKREAQPAAETSYSFKNWEDKIRKTDIVHDIHKFSLKYYSTYTKLPLVRVKEAFTYPNTEGRSIY
jgi:hypothetical protein